MNLFFSVTSALGQSTGETRQMSESARRFSRPRPAVLGVVERYGRKKRSLVLIVDGVQKNSLTYGVAQKLWESFSDYGDVTTYALGQVTPIAVAGQPLLKPRQRNGRANVSSGLCSIGSVRRAVLWWYLMGRSLIWATFNSHRGVIGSC